MDFQSARIERRELKQKLFTIRRYMEGENIELDAELRRVKKLYESLPGFSDWSDFPERWDIGDPYSVKRESPTFSDVDAEMAARKFGKGYNTIVRLD